MVRQQDYVLTAPDDGVIAVVHRRRDRSSGVPSWVSRAGPGVGDQVTAPRKRRCSVVIGDPQPGAGLILATFRGTWGRLPYLQVWAGPDRLLGVLQPSRVIGRQYLEFSSCTCGRPPHRCECGSRWGTVVRGHSRLRTRSWTVVDERGVDVAEVSAQPSSEPANRSVVVAIRAALDPITCAVTETEPGFSWDERGLLVAIAALCDPRTIRRALPPSTGGGP